MTERGEAKVARVEPPAQRQPRFFGKLPAELVTKIFTMAMTPYGDWLEEVGDLSCAIKRVAKIRALNKSCASWMFVTLCRMVIRVLQRKRSILRCNVYTHDSFDIANKHNRGKDRVITGLFDVMIENTDGAGAFRGLQYLARVHEWEHGRYVRMMADLEATGRIRPLSP